MSDCRLPVVLVHRTQIFLRRRQAPLTLPTKSKEGQLELAVPHRRNGNGVLSSVSKRSLAFLSCDAAAPIPAHQGLLTVRRRPAKLVDGGHASAPPTIDEVVPRSTVGPLHHAAARCGSPHRSGEDWLLRREPGVAAEQDQMPPRVRLSEMRLDRRPIFRRQAPDDFRNTPVLAGFGQFKRPIDCRCHGSRR